MNKKFWVIEIENFYGSTKTYYFKNEESAVASFKTLYEYAQNLRDFEYNKETNSISWGYTINIFYCEACAKLKEITINFNDTIPNWSDFWNKKNKKDA